MSPRFLGALAALGLHVPLALAVIGAAPPRLSAPEVRGSKVVSVDLVAPRPQRRPWIAAVAGTGSRRSASRASAPAPRARVPREAPLTLPGLRPEPRLDAAPGATLLTGSLAAPFIAGAKGRGGAGGDGPGEGIGPRGPYASSEVDVVPRRTAGSAPRYPALEAAAGREGEALLRIVVLEDGSVAAVTIEKCQGSPSFGDAAREAVLGWRFEPARRGGRAVACVCTQKLVFALGRR